ncbi:MAG TPA: DUF1287 domain-containing protein [Candidatus Angelobacter sp.]|nr:DUF1287 domain-containing protein [Candidatus Angelobacter sp.]
MSSLGRTLRSSTLAAFLVLAFTALHSQTAPGPPETRQNFLDRLSTAAIERTQHTVRYDPGYVAMSYPGGDVPPEAGVCSDEVIRSYRALGIDLQKEVHEDMKKHFTAYPEGSRTLDRNIAHRRVANLMIFFGRNGERRPVTHNARDYVPGDLVTWDLGNGLNHIGIVVDQKSPSSGRYMIVHNIGEGPMMEDVLFNWKITGHYRYFGPA